MRPSDLPLIRRSRLFAQLGEPELAALLSSCFVQTLPKGAVPCRQNEKPEFLHVVLSGAVGSESRVIQSLLDAPSAIWSLGVSLSQVLFDGGRIVTQPAALYI